MPPSRNRRSLRWLLPLALAVAIAPRAAAQPSNVPINFDAFAIETGVGTQLTGALSGVVMPDRLYLMSNGNPNYPGTGLSCRSGTNCAFNFLQSSFGFSSLVGPITMSGWIRGWNVRGSFGSDDAARNLLIEGFDAAGNLVASQTMALGLDYRQFTFTTLFSSIRFTPQGAPWFGADCTTCGRVLMDDLIVNPTTTPPAPGVVPEPSTYALLATGLVGLAALARRRRSPRTDA